MKNTNVDRELAPTITKAASEQTYYTIRYLVDSERVADAYRAYAYFRWVDDTLDAETTSSAERTAFIERQKSLFRLMIQAVMLIVPGCGAGYNSPANISRRAGII